MSTVIRAWDNPVPMFCDETTVPRYGGHAYATACGRDAAFVEVDGGVVTRFLCREHAVEVTGRYHPSVTTT